MFGGPGLVEYRGEISVVIFAAGEIGSFGSDRAEGFAIAGKGEGQVGSTLVKECINFEGLDGSADLVDEAKPFSPGRRCISSLHLRASEEIIFTLPVKAYILWRSCISSTRLRRMTSMGPTMFDGSERPATFFAMTL